MKTIISWIEQHELSCFYKSTFGMDCPGCGTQTAFVLLLKGDLIQSFYTYPPLMLFISLFLFLLLHLFLKFRSGGVIVKYLFLSAAASVVINFIFRLIHHS